MRLLYLSCFITFLFFALTYTDALDEAPTRSTLVLRDNNHSNDSSDKSDKKDDDKKSSKTRVTTEIDVIYTTIIVATPSPITPVYNMTNTGSANQQGSSSNSGQQAPAAPAPGPSNSSVKGPNESITEQATKDQQAITRMTLTLSLVGGLGVIAVVATLVIFTRLRANTRKQRELEEGGSTYELSGEGDDVHPDNNSSHGNDTPGTHSAPSSIRSSPDDTASINIEPSAPPALLVIGSSESRYSLLNRQQNRRNVISMSSQMTAAPSPSAPTAKELDAMEDHPNGCSSSGVNNTNDNPSTSSISHHHSSSTSNCSRCAPLITPELPPPAYTPSAPPHYALPVEPVVMERSSPPPLLPSRRHSLGG